MMKRFAQRRAVLLLWGALLSGAGCTKPAPPPAAAPAASTEATSLQAPFVLRLAGPAAVPTGGRLDLLAVLETPPSSRGLVAIEVEVLLPSGVALIGGLLKQEVRLGGKVRQAVLPLSFQLIGPLTQPIAVRASLRVGRSLGAVAERLYPEPAPSAPASPVDPPGGPGSGQPAGGIPIATPIETVR